MGIRMIIIILLTSYHWGLCLPLNVTIKRKSTQRYEFINRVCYSGIGALMLCVFSRFLLVYSIVDRNSFDEIPKLCKTILRVKERPSFPMILVGNKADLEYERVVSFQEGEQQAQSLNIKYIETSAKHRINVDGVFNDLVRIIRKYKKPENPKPKKPKIFKCQLL